MNFNCQRVAGLAEGLPMDGLSKEQDLSFFVGAEITQICIGQNETILRFIEDIHIEIYTEEIVVAIADERKIKYSDLTVTDSTDADLPDISTSLIRVLRDPVKSAAATDDGGLILQFQSGSEIQLYNDTACYEAFVIRYGEKYIVA